MGAVQVGLKDFHIAILKKDDETGVDYEVPIKAAPIVKAKINPKSSTLKIPADDGTYEIIEAFDDVDVEIEVADFPLKMQAMVLGHKLQNGVMIENANDTAPYVAIGFKSKKSNGKYRYLWLLKGKFAIFADEYETQGDKPKPQSPKLKGTFVKRISDEDWRYKADEDEENFTSATATNWFKNVFNKAALTGAKN